jgi:hypothetical protein
MMLQHIRLMLGFTQRRMAASKPWRSRMRDWFAWQALAHTPRDGQPSERAAWAYALADAMLAERSKR